MTGPIIGHSTELVIRCHVCGFWAMWEHIGVKVDECCGKPTTTSLEDVPIYHAGGER